MFSDLFDLITTRLWKILLFFALVGMGSGLFLWANYENQRLAAQARQRREKIRQKHLRQAALIRKHLLKRNRARLAISLKVQKRRLLLWKSQPTYSGWVRPHQQGLAFLVRDKRREARLFADLEGDGMTNKDLIGRVALKRGQPGHPKSQPWGHFSLFRQRKYRKLYEQALLGTLRAIHEDRAHLEKIKALRKRKRLQFIARVPKPKWKFWKKRKRTFLLYTLQEKEGTALVFVYQNKHRSYGCKRHILTPWKKQCQGEQEHQLVVIDRGQPGLNPGEKDAHGLLVVRAGRPYDTTKLRPFDQLTMLAQFALRERYKSWIHFAYEAHQPTYPTLRKAGKTAKKQKLPLTHKRPQGQPQRGHQVPQRGHQMPQRVRPARAKEVKPASRPQAPTRTRPQVPREPQATAPHKRAPKRPPLR